MKSAIFAVYGASGCGRGIMPLAKQVLKQQGISLSQLYFIDDHPQRPAKVNGQLVLSYNEFLQRDASERYVAIAIANSTVREKLAQKLANNDIQPWHVQADNVVIMDEVSIGCGALLSPFVTLTSNIQIGKFFHANLYSYVEHDCIIGDYVTFAPGVKCNGNIHIEDHVYIGTGVVIKQGTPDKPLVIGKGAVLGMGAVVTKSVAAGDVVVGNPARSMKTQ